MAEQDDTTTEGLKQTGGQAAEALAAAGYDVRRQPGKMPRVYQVGRTGAYLVLEGGFRDAEWARYVIAKEGRSSTKCSGAFHAAVTDVLRAQRAEIKAAAEAAKGGAR